MSDDIVERLRDLATDHARHRTHYDGCERTHLECAAICAADEIEQLRAAGDALVAALENNMIATAVVLVNEWWEARRG